MQMHELQDDNLTFLTSSRLVTTKIEVYTSQKDHEVSNKPKVTGKEKHMPIFFTA